MGNTDREVSVVHAAPADEVLARLEASDKGLSESTARERLVEHGPNTIERIAADTALRILWRQIDNPLIWVLVGAALVAVALGALTDGLVVTAVVVLNALIGFVQEYRARDAIESLRTMVPESANALRDGRLRSVPVQELVPGDVVQLTSGDRVPADMRLVRAKGLRVDEAPLTGESTPVDKSVAPVPAETPLAERTCIVFGGTLVQTGTATGVVVATGAKTELGRISSLMEGTSDLETPLTRTLNVLGRQITMAILAVTALMLVVGSVRGIRAGLGAFEAVRETFVFAIALAVGAIPEGLPAIVTIALAIGVRRMADRRAIIRKLPAVETLGSTTVICTDKTGTLTRNEMTVLALWTRDDGVVRVDGIGYEPRGSFHAETERVRPELTDGLRTLIEAGALCSDAELVRDDAKGYAIAGDPTEGALVVVAEKAGMSVASLRAANPRRDVIPFESEHKFMATLQGEGEAARVVLKGAPEVVMPRLAPLPEEEVARIHAMVERFAEEGMRVLAFAEKRPAAFATGLSFDDVAGELTLTGLTAMLDPPRPEVALAIRACGEAGIEVKMITGDHLLTARAVGRDIGLRNSELALAGSSIEGLGGDALSAAASRTSVFARVAPEHKLRLVESLQRAGHVVAMTGDGVNDAPSLKQANIGVAMGITGTSVSKEAADMILTDDNFATIVAAVEEGRRVYDNLIKSLVFVLPTNLALALIMIVAVVAFPFDHRNGVLLLPIAPAQLLWINLVAAVTLALPLAFEAKEPDVMRRPPRDADAPVLSRRVILRTIGASLMMTTAVVGLFWWELSRYLAEASAPARALAEAQTMAVTTAIAFQIFYLFQCRSLRVPLLELGLFSNGWVFVGVSVIALLQAAFIYLAPLQLVFGTAPLTLDELGLSVGVGALPLVLIGLEKRLERVLWQPLAHSR